MANKLKHLIEPENQDLAEKLKIMAGVTDLNKGIANRGFRLTDEDFRKAQRDPWVTGRLPNGQVFNGPRSEFIAKEREMADLPVLGLLPNGQGYIGPAGKIKTLKHDIGQQMAWDRTLRTGSNIGGGIFGALSYGAATAHLLDADTLSDLGSYADLGTQLF